MEAATKPRPSEPGADVADSSSAATHDEPVPSAEGHVPLDASQIFRLEFRYVWSSLRRLGVLEADLEDLTHEVFVRVHAQLGLFDPSRPVRPWLFGIALGMAANYRRLARHRVEVRREVSELPDASGGADEMFERHKRRQLVHAALDKLPIEQRAVLVLHEMDGFAMPEVALALGININTAYSRLRIGRSAFKAAAQRLALSHGGVLR
jgi:RNA polymerase sigma-70 factor (ECF subfamily)